MSQADQDKWDARYRDGAYQSRTHPSALLQDWLPRLKIASQQPRALDIACGAGRNALHLARNGWQVDALDVSQVALERLAASAAAENLSVACTRTDLDEASSLADFLHGAEPYDLVLIVRYTNLPLIDQVMPVIQPGAYLVVEEHLQTAAQVVGPRNPDFRVPPGALREAAAGLAIVEYREGMVDEPDGRVAALAQLIASSRMR